MRAFLWTSLLLSTLFACSNTSPPPSQGDISTGRATGSVPCDSLVFDFWRVQVAGGASLRVIVDATDPSTTFDPAFGVRSVTAWGETPQSIEVEYQLSWTDDGFSCSAAPTSGECPQDIVDLSGAGTDWTDGDVLVIVSAENGACAGPDAGYELSVEMDGDPAALTYVGQSHMNDTTL